MARRLYLNFTEQAQRQKQSLGATYCPQCPLVPQQQQLGSIIQLQYASTRPVEGIGEALHDTFARSCIARRGQYIAIILFLGKLLQHCIILLNTYNLDLK